MQKVDEIKLNYKQCQDVLDCAEKRLQTNGLGVTTDGQSLVFFIFSSRDSKFRSGCHGAECLYRNGQCRFQGESNPQISRSEMMIIFFVISSGWSWFRIWSTVFSGIRTNPLMFNFASFLLFTSVRFVQKNLKFLKMCIELKERPKRRQSISWVSFELVNLLSPSWEKFKRTFALQRWITDNQFYWKKRSINVSIVIVEWNEMRRNLVFTVE